MDLSMYAPQLPLLDYTRQFREALPGKKIVLTQSVVDLDNAERVLEEGVADFVGMFRPLLADPDIVKKYARDQRDEVNFCIRCQYHGKFALHLPITCAVNPLCGREAEYPQGVVPPAPERKKVMVVGGGPAGMQAAWTATQRGHDVVLYERGALLGGNMHKAATLPFKREIQKFIDYLTAHVERCGARIELGCEATAETVAAEAPDVLILAAGADDAVPPIPGIDGAHVSFCHEADAGLVDVGQRVVVIGAGNVGMETAIQLGREGREVTVLERDPADVAIPRRAAFGMPQEALLKEAGAKVAYGCAIERIGEDSVAYRDAEGAEHELPCDTVLLAAGVRPRKGVVEALRHAIPECDVYQVGDLTEPGSIGHAVNSGFDIAAHI